MRRVVLLIALVSVLNGCPMLMNEDYHNLGGGYEYNKVGINASTISRKGEPILIGPTVVSYAFNEKYIAALEQPWFQYMEGDIAKYKLKKKCDYWIIDKETHEITGPFTKAEYIGQSKITGIPVNRLGKAEWSKTSRYCFSDPE